MGARGRKRLGAPEPQGCRPTLSVRDTRPKDGTTACQTKTQGFSFYLNVCWMLVCVAMKWLSRLLGFCENCIWEFKVGWFFFWIFKVKHHRSLCNVCWRIRSFWLFCCNKLWIFYVVIEWNVSLEKLRTETISLLLFIVHKLLWQEAMHSIRTIDKAWKCYGFI